MILLLSLLLSLPAVAENEADDEAKSAPEPEAEETPAPPKPAPAQALPPKPPLSPAPPPHPRPPQGKDHPAPIGPPPPKGHPPHPPPVHPVAEVRINWDFSDLHNVTGEQWGEAFSHGFTVPRAELGLVAHISERIETRTVLHATEAHEQIDVDSALTREHIVERYPNGWSVQAQDVYATIRPTDSERFWIQPGVQMTILGSRNLFDEARGDYYLVGPRTEEVAELAEVVHGRDLGLRVHGEVADVLGIDAMVANGNGHTGIGEDNVAKDLSLRLDLGVTKSLHLIASGQRAVDGEEGNQQDLVWSVMTEWRADRLRAMVEAIGGTEDHGRDDLRQFLGGQGGLAIEQEHRGPWLSSRVLTARVGYFDPRIHTVDADAWLTADLSAQGWWNARGPMGLMTGLGYNMWMPMDETQPVSHAVTLQTLFQI